MQSLLKSYNSESGALPALPQEILCDDTITKPQTASSQIAQSYRSANPPVSQPVPQWEQLARSNINGTARSYAYGSSGWTEYTLPDGVRYYANERSRAITDLDLWSLTKLDEVSNIIDASGGAPEGCEMWIRAGSNAQKGWGKQTVGGEPAVLWVDHRHRWVFCETPSDDYVLSGEYKRLDEECEYWAFVEMHPAHIPEGIIGIARNEVIDALHWSHAEYLTTVTHHSLPFSQDECINLIEVFGRLNYPITPAHTQVVARVLLRFARWRRVHLHGEVALLDRHLSDRNLLRYVTAKDPEALLDTQNFNDTDASQTDPSIIAALITALGLLNAHSSNPKVAVFQLSAVAVSFTLMALHSFHSKTLADAHSRELTLVQRLLKYFPPFIFASCWILFLLSITFTFPKPMSVAVCLVVFASIPMVCGARLPAALTLAIITLFTLTFFTLVFLVCVLPTEWLA